MNGDERVKTGPNSSVEVRTGPKMAGIERYMQSKSLQQQWEQSKLQTQIELHRAARKVLPAVGIAAIALSLQITVTAVRNTALVIWYALPTTEIKAGG